jgi:hypothetical protein
MMGSTSSEISDQLRDRYSICKCCLNVATYVYEKFTMGKLKYFLQSQVSFSMCSVCLATQLCAVYFKIILIELMYIVFVPFDWTRALSPVCFGFVHNSTIFFCVFDPFITR